jgi:initiation factor 1A
MPKNVGGGKKYKKRKTKAPIGPGRIMYPDEDQLYGIVLKRLGNGWVNLVVCDNMGGNVRKVLGRIRGVLRKRRVPFFEGSHVIACGRDFVSTSIEKEKVDVIHKYYDDHVRILNRENRIPTEMKRELDGITKTVDPAKRDDDDDDFDIIFDDDAGEENDREFDAADIDDL